MRPISPALAAPVGHPGRPQNGQTALMEYNPEKPMNQPRNRQMLGFLTGAGPAAAWPCSWWSWQ